MLALIGIAVVFIAVFGGYLLERGNPWVLMQPAELVILRGERRIVRFVVPGEYPDRE